MFADKFVQNAPNERQREQLNEFASALLAAVDEKRMSDSNLIRSRASMTEVMINNLNAFEVKVAELEAKLRERDAALASATSKLRAEADKSAKLQSELLDLNRVMKQLEDTYRQSVADASKFNQTLQKTIADLQSQVAVLNQKLAESAQQTKQAEEAAEAAHRLADAKDLEVAALKKNFVPLEKYRKVLEEREVAIEKALSLENNLLTQTTHNEKLRDRLNTVKQEFQSTLSDNDERHRKEISDLHNQAARKFDTNNQLTAPRDSSQRPNGSTREKDQLRAKSHTVKEMEVKRPSLLDGDVDNLRISWEQIDVNLSQARDDGAVNGGPRNAKRNSMDAKYDDMKSQYEQFKTDHAKELATVNSKNRSLLDEVNRLKLEVQRANAEKNTLKKSLNDATSRDNSFIRKSSTPQGTNDALEKVARLEKQLNGLRKENQLLKARLEDDGVRFHWQNELLYTACLDLMKGGR